MRFDRKQVLRVLPWLATAVFTIVVIGPVSEFFIELARDKGWYDDPSESWAAIMEFFSFAGSWWFQWLAALTIGFTGGMWLDAIWRRKTVLPEIEQTPFDIVEYGNELNDWASAGLAECRAYINELPKLSNEEAANRDRFDRIHALREERKTRFYSYFAEKYSAELYFHLSKLERIGVNLRSREIQWHVRMNPLTQFVLLKMTAKHLMEDNREAASAIGEEDARTISSGTESLP